MQLKYKMKIISKEKSKLIDRTELIIEFSHQGKPTPSETELKKELANELKTKEELIIIKLIDTKFGEGNSIISAHIYDSLEELKKLEKYVKPKVEEKSTEEIKDKENKKDGKESKTEE